MTLHIRSEVFVREDLEAILTATAALLGSETTQGREAASERRGAARALAAIAIAIHVAPEPLVERLRPVTRTVWPEIES